MVLAPTMDALAFLDGLQPSRMVFDLRGFEGVLAAVGNPQAAFPAMHVAGTNGKGSVCAVAEAVLRSFGLHTGRYTSPHLDHPRERITVDGAALDADAFATAVLALRELIAGRIPTATYTYFDFLTALAFQEFAARAVDVAVVETGLGGRLDSTRPCLPRVTCITPISHDHTNILGDDLADIAGEKAGILRPGVPCVIAPQPEAAAKVLTGRADEINTPLALFGRDFSAEVIEHRPAGERIIYRPLHGAPLELTLPLAGDHQVANAACALAAARHWWPAGSRRCRGRAAASGSARSASSWMVPTMPGAPRPWGVIWLGSVPRCTWCGACCAAKTPRLSSPHWDCRCKA